MKKVAIIISPNYKDYAEKYLADCLVSIRQQDYAGEKKIFIADNESTNDSYEYIKSVISGKITPLHPPLEGGQQEIIRNKTNDGFAKGNNNAIKLALAQGFDYIILFNMDTVIEKNCVGELVRVAEETFLDSRLRGNDKRQIGAVQARIMLFPENELINSLGNVTHFLGFGYAEGYKKEFAPTLSLLRRGSKSEVEICYPSGAAVLYKAEVLKKVGLFDEEMWMYNEDQDLGWRIWLAGYKCVLAPEAVVYHKYEFNRSIKKYYWLDRNRIIAMLKNYHWATLVLIFPAFLAMEIGLLFFAFRGGWLKEKINVYKYFLNLKNWRYIIRERKNIQQARMVKDKGIVKMFSGKIWYQEIGDRRLKIVNPVFNAYWQIARFLIRW